MKIDKKKIWKTVFYMGVVIYIINLICIIASGDCIFIRSSNFYNYSAVILNAVFMIIFYNFLKKGSLTVRYLLIMFLVLVVLPFLVAVIFGGIGFAQGV